MSESIAVVVQARIGSSRLPGKVALPVSGAPLLVRMLERVRAAKTPFELVVATSVLPEDDLIVELVRPLGVRVFRGHPLDCLNRHLGAARATRADWVVKIPSDCPLIDPGVIDQVLEVALEGTHDFVSNLHPPTWPDGNDVEVVPTELLALADREAVRPLEREHTTPFFWEQPQRFDVMNVRWDSGRDLSMTHRFTIDYPDDYRFVRAVYGALYGGGRVFELDDILELLLACPGIYSLNAHYAGVNWYRHHVDELKTITPTMTRTDVR
jgi:spore coat polysaccharide biosynthesis protein SpsF